MLLQFLAAPFLLVFDALSFVVAGALTLSVRPPTEHASLQTPRVAPGDVWAILRVPFLRRCVLVVLYASLANGAVSALLVLFMIRELHLTTAEIGIVAGAGALGGFLAGATIGAVHARLGAAYTAAVGAP